MNSETASPDQHGEAASPSPQPLHLHVFRVEDIQRAYDRKVEELKLNAARYFLNHRSHPNFSYTQEFLDKARNTAAQIEGIVSLCSDLQIELPGVGQLNIPRLN